jgi:hypothetical protein
MQSRAKCPNCKSQTGAKLNEMTIEELAWEFFIYGSFDSQFRAVVTSVKPDLRDNASNMAASVSVSLQVSSGAEGA